MKHHHTVIQGRVLLLTKAAAMQPMAGAAHFVTMVSLDHTRATTAWTMRVRHDTRVEWGALVAQAKQHHETVIKPAFSDANRNKR